MAADGGFALAWMVAPTVGKRVFLLVVSTIPTVMRCMTPSATTVKKAASGRSKSPAFAGTKTAANRGPSPNPPKGREFLLAVFEVVVWRSFPLGKVRMGLAGAPSPWEGTEKLPLFPFYRRGQTSLSGVYEAFWLRCVVRVKSKNRPREGLGTLPNGFLGDVLADM